MGDGMLRVSGSKLIERGEGMGEQAMTQEGIGLPTTFAKCFAALFLCFFYNRERGWIGGGWKRSINPTDLRSFLNEFHFTALVETPSTNVAPRISRII